MTISLAFLDDGISNSLQGSTGRLAVYEHDFIDGDGETDEGIARNHGSGVAYAAMRTSAACGLVDLKVSAASSPFCLFEDIAEALDALIGGIATGYDVNTVNMSFGGSFCPDFIHARFDQLTALGVILVASSGNGGREGTLEWSSYPARLPNVISVGSHNGSGRPSGFSQQGRDTDILADGENFPWPGWHGTSFSAPQVAATVAHIQAIGEGLTGGQMSVGQVVDALRQGGAAPRSQLDPANHTTRYVLEQHSGVLDYTWSKHGGSPTTALEYIASHEDLMRAFGANAAAGRQHYEHQGSIEERPITFDGLDYIASYADLSHALGGVNALAGANHIPHRRGRRSEDQFRWA